MQQFYLTTKAQTPVVNLMRKSFYYIDTFNQRLGGQIASRKKATLIEMRDIHFTLTFQH